jgi:hypothetical protein
MGPDQIQLMLEDDGSEGTYSFECPNCADPVSKQADRKIVALLVSAGVFVAQDTPAPEPQFTEHDEAPPFTVDDLIAFHEMLADDSFLVRMVAGR